MSEHPWFSLLNSVGLEQLAGIAVGSTVLCVCWLILMQIVRRQSASVQSGVWQATCSANVLTAFVLFAVPGVPLKIETAAAIEAENSVLVTALDNPAPVKPGIQQDCSTPTEFPESRVAAQPVATGHLTPSVMPALADDVVSARSLDAIEAVPASQSTIDLPSMLAAAWIAVFSYLLIAFGRSVVRCRSIIATASREVPSNIRDGAELVRKRLGLHQCPRLVLADEFRVPFTAGIFRPVIVLPKVAAEWSTEKISMVIAHEMAHVERRDVLWHWIGRLAVCIAWFNPLVWFAAKRGFLDRERACDDRVIGAGFAATEYGQCLVEVAASLSGVRMPLSATVSMAEPPLKQRLSWILSATADRRRASTGLRGVLIAAFVFVAIGLGIPRPWVTAPMANAAGADQAAEAAPAVKQDAALGDNAGSDDARKVSTDQAETDSIIELTKPVIGTVIDEVGNPIAGARVIVKSQDFIDGINDMQRYQLQPGENLRRVAPPFPAGRMDFYRKEHARQAESMPNGPSTIGFTWKDGELNINSMLFGDLERGNPVAEALTYICKVGPQYLRGDDQLLRRQITGDFVVRSDASPESLIADFEKILSAAWNAKITLALKETEEDVYVARGVFELSKFAQERGLVIIEGANQGGPKTIEEAIRRRPGAARPPFGYFVETCVAEAIGFPVINEVENPPDVRVYYNFVEYHFPENVSGFQTLPSGGFVVPPEPILKSVSDQTGLTFTKEKRRVKTLTLQLAR